MAPVESLRRYFSQFGEIGHCTIMRDNLTGRSRGFAFLNFVDPKAVNTVMVREHYLDGKVVRVLPSLALPRYRTKLTQSNSLSFDAPDRSKTSNPTPTRWRLPPRSTTATTSLWWQQLQHQHQLFRPFFRWTKAFRRWTSWIDNTRNLPSVL